MFQVKAGQSHSQVHIEEHDEFEVGDDANVEIDAVREWTATIQDLLLVIKSADKDEALPQAMILLELAATTPLTSVHW